MKDVVPEMLAGFYSRAYDRDPLFCWSCSDGSGGELAEGTSGQKDLSVVYGQFPEFNAQNTLLVDSKSCRVIGNAEDNIFIANPFYVKWLRTLADDREYLKSFLWPLLEAFWRCPDLSTFRAKYPQVVNESKSEWLLNRMRGTGYDFVYMVGGEGTCRPVGFQHPASPHLHFFTHIEIVLLVCVGEDRKAEHKIEVGIRHGEET
jgi:hypothetical protein